MKNHVLLWLLLLPATLSLAQKADISPTDRFRIKGQVAQERVVTLEELMALPAQPIKALTITSLSGEKKSTFRKAKGVLLRTLLEQVELQAENPRVLSEFYLTCIASDGFKVVFSWNELFNNPVGEQVYLVTERDGQQLPVLEGRIMILAASDVRTGRRHLKALETIVVGRAE